MFLKESTMTKNKRAIKPEDLAMSIGEASKNLIGSGFCGAQRIPAGFQLSRLVQLFVLMGEAYHHGLSLMGYLHGTPWADQLPESFQATNPICVDIAFAAVRKLATGQAIETRECEELITVIEAFAAAYDRVEMIYSTTG